MSLASDLLAEVDKVVATANGAGAGAMTGYVIPAAWAIFAVSLLVWSVLVMQGKISSPMNEWVIKGGTFLLVILAAGVFYQKWVATPLLGMQSEMTSAMSGSGSATSVLDKIDARIDSIIRSCFAAMGELPKALGVIPDLPSLFALLVAAVVFGIAGGLLEIVALVNLIYAKLGLALVLMVGPFFVASLAVPAVKGWFFSWLNTCMYFVFLSVLTSAYISMCLSLAESFIAKVMTAAGVTTAALGTAGVGQVFAIYGNGLIIPLLMASFKFLIIAVILFFLGLELRSVASSITGGSGGSAGAGMMSMGRSAMNISNQRQSQALMQAQIAALKGGK